MISIDHIVGMSAKPVIPRNRLAASFLGAPGVDFLVFACDAIRRLLPHTVTDWMPLARRKIGRKHQPKNQATWGDPRRRHINILIGIDVKQDDVTKTYFLRARVERTKPPSGVASIARTLDEQEKDICDRIAKRASHILATLSQRTEENLSPYRDSFDGDIVAEHVTGYLRAYNPKINLNVPKILNALHTLAEETYENKALSFGCILDPNTHTQALSVFPDDLFKRKKYKALTDGFRSAYVISASGALSRFVDLSIQSKKVSKVKEKRTYPEWAFDIARLSQDGKCGICLTRSGELLILYEGTLRFSYRFGRWKYFNHAHIIDLLKGLARVQRVPARKIGAVARRVYLTALDVSFRRTGGLLVVLRNSGGLRDLVRTGDAISDAVRDPLDEELDRALPGNKMVQRMPRRVLAELAGIDGALVISNSGELLAYGAILDPKKKGRTRGMEGSRSKAAKGASHYGLTVKISSDGDIGVYKDGKQVFAG